MIRVVCAVFGLFCLAVTLAHAQFLSPSVFGSKPCFPYKGPGDTLAATAWYGLRAYSSAKIGGTTKSINIRRVSDSTTSDIVILTTGLLDVATATTFCASTTCFVHTWYDQVAGNACGAASCDMVQATAGNQPQLIFNCWLTSQPCLQSTTSNVHQVASANNLTPATGSVSLTTVGNRVSGTGNSTFIGENGILNRLVSSGTANKWLLAGGTSGQIQPTANDNVFHAMTGAINSGVTSGSTVNLDGVETTGTVTGSTTAGKPIFAGGTSTTADGVEAGIWDNVVFTAAQRMTINNNAHQCWGF